MARHLRPHGHRLRRGVAAIAASPGIRRVWEAVDPKLPPEVEPFSFVSVVLLCHVANALALSLGETLVDLGCGRGGPGLWLARSQSVSLIGVDFSAVAVQQAGDRAALFGLADRARFVVGDLAATGLPDASADAIVSIDAMHLAADLPAAGREVLRILRPGHRLVLTSWQPRTAEESRLPSRLCIDWAVALRSVGFVEVQVESEPSGMSCSPGSIESHSTLATQVTTSRWLGCRTRRAGTSRWRIWLTGSWSLPTVPMAKSQLVPPASFRGFRLELEREQPGISEDNGAALVCCTAAWLISDPQRGQLAACETDVDLLLNDALARVLVDSRIRVEVWHPSTRPPTRWI